MKTWQAGLLGLALGTGSVLLYRELAEAEEEGQTELEASVEFE